MIDSRLTRLILSLALPIALLAASTRLLLSHQFLQFEYTRPGIPADSYGFSSEDRLRYGRFAMDYLFNAESIDWLESLRLPLDLCWSPSLDAQDCPLFNATELRHMRDVKQLTVALFALGLVGALVIALALSLDWRAALAGMERGAWLTLLVILALGIVSFAAWDSAFDRFHELFFAAGTWRFPFSDSLIRLYPERLFVDAALAIAGICAAGAGGILAICGLLRRRDASI